MDWVVLVYALRGNFINLENSQHISVYIPFPSLVVHFAAGVIGTFGDFCF